MPILSLLSAVRMRRASQNDWRAEEWSRSALAQQLHLAAAVDLVRAPAQWEAAPRDGLLDDLLAHRVRSGVPSIYLSRAAARLAVLAVLAELAMEGSSSRIWRGNSLSHFVEKLKSVTPALVPGGYTDLAEDLPCLREVTNGLTDLDRVALVRLASRTFELAESTFWVFRDAQSPPVKLWDSSRSKKRGSFFTPSFIGRHLASRALPSRGAVSVLDPAVGAGNLLIEAALILREAQAPRSVLESLHGVDKDPALVELSAVLLTTLTVGWKGGKPPTLGTHLVSADSLLTPLRHGEGERSWNQLFSDQFAAGGFDAVLLNPPYVQLKVNSSSLPLRPGDGAMGSQIRERALNDERRSAIQLAHDLRANPEFEYAHGGTPDLARFFIERSLQLLKPGGRFSCIVPSTLLADSRSATLRRHLFTDHRVTEINVIPESTRLFDDVNQPTCTLVVQAHARPSAIRLRTRVTSPSELRRSAGRLPIALIKAIDESHLRVPTCDAESWSILERMHQHPALAAYPDILNLRGELDLTIDSAYVSDVPTGMRLVRGDQIERYVDDLPATRAAWVDPTFVSERCSTRKREHIHRLRIVLRQCSYIAKPRRLSCALVRDAVVANSCNYLLVSDSSRAGEEELLVLLGFLNSALAEWRFRITNSTNHVGNYELAALPFPRGFDPPVRRAVVRAVKKLLRSNCAEANGLIDDVFFTSYGLSRGERERVRQDVYGRSR
jgi:Alw26I/Eco31I/Esp3I family type II restriction m6 adenine DNA methyltransferase